MNDVFLSNIIKREIFNLGIWTVCRWDSTRELKHLKPFVALHYDTNHADMLHVHNILVIRIWCTLTVVELSSMSMMDSNRCALVNLLTLIRVHNVDPSTTKGCACSVTLPQHECQTPTAPSDNLTACHENHRATWPSPSSSHRLHCPGRLSGVYSGMSGDWKQCRLVW